MGDTGSKLLHLRPVNCFPEGVNAEQAERFLRENGAATCGLPKSD
jgi:hypothetical protein